jgi:1,5-anhydro-D-fructose reductase (1,5-anhydro-D-mannitol-forming)
VKIGIMSFAHTHAADYVRVLVEMPGIELKVSDPERAERSSGEEGGASFAAELGVEYVESYAELAAWRPDAVIVCSENTKHRRDAVLAASWGAHVLCEKPLATTLEDARAIIAACETAGVLLMTAFPVRFSSAFGSLRSAWHDGDLGSVLSVSAANNGRIPPERAWFTDVDLAGGGALIDHVVHSADLIRSLNDGNEPVRVFAAENRMLHADHPDVDTAAVVSVVYENGLIATIDSSWTKPDNYPVWGGLSLRVVGTGGIADADMFSEQVVGHSLEHGSIVIPIGADTNRFMLEEFIAAIGEGRTPLVTGEDGYASLRIVVAAYESVRTGRAVHLDSLDPTVGSADTSAASHQQHTVEGSH